MTKAHSIIIILQVPTAVMHIIQRHFIHGQKTENTVVLESWPNWIRTSTALANRFVRSRGKEYDFWLNYMNFIDEEWKFKE